ncbi:DMT family transporter [uncultured Desulfosarcina sp.]|uniref:DMT family transporter n=1 Tax=uncultured Desulfosarcina sp. TaxID=218289 RepID=UPI0029C63DAE|nr:DMT family transporter [uncultured Desulfosarcina sp.]
MPADNTRSLNHALWRTTLGAIMISFSAVWVKLAHVPPTVSAFYRVFFGGLFLLIILLVRREKLWRGWHCLGLSLLAAIFFALDLYTWHRSIVHVGPGLATILGNFEVFLVPAVGVLLFGERLNLRFVLSVPLAVAGLFMIVGLRWEQLSPDYRIGIGYGLSTAFFYTGFLIVLRKLQSHTSKPSAALSLMVVSFSTALYLALEMVRTGNSFSIPDLQSGLSLVALGLMCQTLGWLLITRSLPWIPAAVAGLVLLLQPSLSFIWDVLFFNRTTSALAWVGVILALSAIYLGATSGRKA